MKTTKDLITYLLDNEIEAGDLKEVIPSFNPKNYDEDTAIEILDTWLIAINQKDTAKAQECYQALKLFKETL